MSAEHDPYREVGMGNPCQCEDCLKHREEAAPAVAQAERLQDFFQCTCIGSEQHEDWERDRKCPVHSDSVEEAAAPREPLLGQWAALEALRAAFGDGTGAATIPSPNASK